MYSIIRCLIFFSIIFIILFIAKKKRLCLKKCLIFCGIPWIVLFIGSYFVPVENIFVKFDSPESVYNYYQLGNHDIHTVIEGDCSALVVGSENDVYEILVIPKEKDGWKIGISTNTEKTVIVNEENELYMTIYQLKNTNDTFIEISHFYGNSLDITDSEKSDFASVSITERPYYTYYACISNFGEEYQIFVNGNKINVF